MGDSSDPAHPRRPGWVWIIAIAALTIGLAVEAISFGLADPAGWIPDLLVGWACIGSGMLAASRRPDSRMGLLLICAGFAWFIGNLDAVPVRPLAIAAVQLTLVYRAVLVHAALTLPRGRASGWLHRVAIAGGYVAWSIPATADSIVATMSVCALAIVAALSHVVTSPAPARQARLAALAAVTLLSSAFTVATVVHAAIPNGAADRLALLLNEAAIVAVAAGLTAITLRPGWQAGRVTDLVVEVTRRRSGGVRDALAGALGDPSLEIGYWHRPSDTYLDAFGDPVMPPGPHDPRATTRVDVDGRPVALLIHDPAVLESGELSAAVHTTRVLAATNTRLRGDVLDQLADLRASRQRLILAGDAERRRLERQLDLGPIRRARALEASLDEVAFAAGNRGAADVADQIRRARVALDAVGEDLQRLAQGLHPASITSLGLAAALRSLGDRSPLPVDVTVDADVLPEPVQLAIYYACAEAIANAAKHAKASRVSIRIASTASQVRLAVVDDGAGGADASAGTGLRGIEDRIEALGGHVTVRTEVGRGTGLHAEIPLPLATDGAVVRSGMS